MIVTLLTDFGTGDYFVGAMKGVILSHDPAITIVDLSHRIPRHDIAAAAFHLAAVYREFPIGTVHVVVVDPGVGSARRAIAMGAGDHLFVGPDNGVFSQVLDRESKVEVRAITSREVMREAMGTTFHGRDIFAPAGAALAKGLPIGEIGPKVDEPVRLQAARNVRRSDGTLTGRILHVDRFGNCVTSFRPDDLVGGAEAYRFRVGETRIAEVRPFYKSGPRDAPFMIWGSAGYLEISFDQDSAADRLDVSRGIVVEAHLAK